MEEKILVIDDEAGNISRGGSPLRGNGGACPLARGQKVTVEIPPSKKRKRDRGQEGAAG